ncbi:TTL-domain-containing protein [Trichodelitschia bisporula]|uniref:TTL-domain-containing protein n=1 Tax=Trichodelitschia bisporula TaxID=703511 RepID=A0A6G1HQC5_9PEZI|nr:TTL-domain-containing protein [Trichodelitschia bisporula]
MVSLRSKAKPTTAKDKKLASKSSKAAPKPETKPAEPKPNPKPSRPTHTLILPSTLPPTSRILNLPDPLTATPTRYLSSPTGLYEFTQARTPSQPSTLLLTPAAATPGPSALLTPANITLATPLDFLFLLIPLLTAAEAPAGKFAPLDQFLDHAPASLAAYVRDPYALDKLAARAEAVCDVQDVPGLEKLFRLNEVKVAAEVLGKARRAARGLPASMEEGLVRGPLFDPCSNLRGEAEGKENEAVEGGEVKPSKIVAPEEVVDLMRVRVALDFITRSYIPPAYRTKLDAAVKTLVDWTPLDTHLAELAAKKAVFNQGAGFTESLLQRKRPLDEDAEEGPAKKKKEVKTESRAIAQLKKVNTKGMKPMSSFFKPKDKKVEEKAHRSAPIIFSLSVSTMSTSPSPPHFYALIDYEDPYVQPLILRALRTLPTGSYTLTPSLTSYPGPPSKLLTILPYESLPFSQALSQPTTHLINAYIIRKALIRKHYLASTITSWVAKHPSSPLATGVPRAEEIELDYAEFLDDALVEAWDLRAAFEKNEGKEAHEREWWILKPGMSDRGQGIRLFSTEAELAAIFEGWEADAPASDEEEEEEEDEDVEGAEGGGDGIVTSHLRHFLTQPYIHPPLLLPDHPHKFHLRAYVLAVGALKVYVHRRVLALFAAKPYTPPWEGIDDTSSGPSSGPDLAAHLTNTCFGSGLVSELSTLPAHPALGPDWQEKVFEQVCALTGDVFEAAARGASVHFQALPNAFEVFGVDFMVDGKGQVWLLEVNAFPDFKQSGEEMTGLIQQVWEGVVREGVAPFMGVEVEEKGGEGGMVRVLDIDLGRR